MTMKMPTEVSKRIEQVLPRVAGCCVPDSSQLVYHKIFRRIYRFTLAVICFSIVMTDTVTHRLSEPPLV
jgi:hypothetical protein